MDAVFHHIWESSARFLVFAVLRRIAIRKNWEILRIVAEFLLFLSLIYVFVWFFEDVEVNEWRVLA